MTTLEAVPGRSGDLAQPVSDYAQLRQLIEEERLFERQPRYYAIQTICLLAAFSLGTAGLILVDSLPLLLLNAVFMAAVFTHIGYMIHDAGHRQVFDSVRGNDWLALFFAWFIGMSPSWWIATHNMHHNRPNDLKNDPHTAIPTLAFSTEQASAKSGPLRFLTGFQAFYFFPLLSMESLGARLAGIQFLLSGAARYRPIEAAGMVVHLGAYIALLTLSLPLTHAVAFVLVHQILAGLYMGSVFAPNHKGMPILEEDVDIDFVQRQVLTTRNMKPHPLTDFWCGGLNYQIEHHLFPTLPRNKLKRTRDLVRDFCARRDIPYHEVSFLRSYQEVLGHLHRASQPLRSRRA